MPLPFPPKHWVLRVTLRVVLSGFAPAAGLRQLGIRLAFERGYI
jgi:hypothetical protein